MQNSIKIKFYIPIIIFILAFSNDAKSDLNVVSSIKPIHSITAAIMEGVSEPTLIVDNIASPHSFNLKPSHIEAINGADLIFYVSEDLETFIEKPLDSINKRTNVVELISNEALILLKFRKDIIHSVDDEHEDEEHHDEHEDEEHHDEHEDEEH
ncbi:MAG: metal ABC transporter solute-binding protein, Zn/Mn family, partial [Hyphomicrobiales bacterium]